mmetsp:Transcript_30120/g.51458  ORF Transcript_30120/g.51458 Transcript_30120/m.51458 type:complete len:125 (-) Transcript_30120:1787-2161(-)
MLPIPRYIQIELCTLTLTQDLTFFSVVKPVNQCLNALDEARIKLGIRGKEKQDDVSSLFLSKRGASDVFKQMVRNSPMVLGVTLQRFDEIIHAGESRRQEIVVECAYGEMVNYVNNKVRACIVG